MVAGTAALLKIAAPTTNLDQILAALSGTAKDCGPVGKDPTYGYGLVVASDAVEVFSPAAAASVDQVLGAYGLTEAEPGYDPAYDLNQDSRVDLLDLATSARLARIE
jgi:hypothetical protein